MKMRSQMEMGVGIELDWKGEDVDKLGDKVNAVLSSLSKSVPRFCRLEGIKVVVIKEGDPERVRGWMVVSVVSGFSPWIALLKKDAAKAQERRRKAMDIVNIPHEQLQNIKRMR